MTTLRRSAPLLGLAIYRRRRMLLALAAGVFAFELLMVAIIAAVPPEAMLGGFGGDGPEPPRAFEAFGGSGGDVPLASVEGLLGAGLVHPFWIAMQLAAVLSLAAAVLADDVQQGTIELVALRPVSRRRLIGERLAAVVSAAIAMNVASILGLTIGFAFVDRVREVVSGTGLVLAGVAGTALSLAVAGPAAAASARASRKARALGAGIAFAAVGYVLNFLAAAWEPAEPLRWLSPFHYYRPADALASGSLGWETAVLFGVWVVGAAAAFALVARRDLVR